MQDGNNKGKLWRRERGHVWELSVVWVQFFCKLQNSLKKESLFKKTKTKLLMLIAFLIKRIHGSLEKWLFPDLR